MRFGLQHLVRGSETGMDKLFPCPYTRVYNYESKMCQGMSAFHENQAQKLRDGEDIKIPYFSKQFLNYYTFT